MVKIQQFFVKHQKIILSLNTVLLLLAEAAKWLFHINAAYQILMLVVGVIGLIPILLTAISSLKVKLVSIDVLVSLAVIGAVIIGEFNDFNNYVINTQIAAFTSSGILFFGGIIGCLTIIIVLAVKKRKSKQNPQSRTTNSPITDTTTK